MMVKSAALSSNQAVGVKKSLNNKYIENKNKTNVGGKDHSREPWICKSVCSDRSKIGKDKMVVVHLLAIEGYSVFEDVTKIQL